jgi:hypothetical protein
MFEQMEDSVDRCWAWNKSGQRCELIAGHDRDHSVIIAWTNDECWTPGDTAPSRAMGIADGLIAATPLIVEEPVQERCDICEHPWHDAPCTVTVEFDDECGCAKAA